MSKTDRGSAYLLTLNLTYIMADITANAPKTEKLLGEITQIAKIEDLKLVLVSIQSADDKIVTLSTGEAYWTKVGKFFKEGSIVQATIENRIKDKTTYEKDGKNVFHTSTGTNLTGIVAYSAAAYQRAIFNARLENAEGSLNSVELERAGAFATLYGMALAVKM